MQNDPLTSVPTLESAKMFLTEVRRGKRSGASREQLGRRLRPKGAPPYRYNSVVYNIGHFARCANIVLERLGYEFERVYHKVYVPEIRMHRWYRASLLEDAIESIDEVLFELDN